MHFAIWTTNKPKSEAITHVISTAPYHLESATFSYHKVLSWVPDMPTTLAELKIGAKNRALHTRRDVPSADFFVGMEGGVYRDSIDEKYWLIGVVYIENQDGEWHFWYSCHLEVPERVVDGLFDGRWRDLEQIMEEIAGLKNIGDHHGSYHAWTDGMLTRKEQFVMATQCAIAPFFNEFYSIK